MAKKERNCRVYQYGLHAPTLNADLIEEQFKLGRQYRAALIWLLKARRAAERDLELRMGLSKEHAAVVKTRKKLDEALAAAKAAKSRLRKRTAPQAERAAVQAARKKLKVAKEKLKIRRQELRELMVPEKDRIKARWTDMCRSLRTHYGSKGKGLRHGTYSAVEEAVKQAHGSTPLWFKGEPRDPKMRHWRDGFAIGVQLPYGRKLDEVFDADGTLTQIRFGFVDDRPERQSKYKKQGEGRRADRRRFALLRVRVGTREPTEEDKSRPPIWGEWPCLIHRMPPEGSRIKRVMVSRRFEGPHVRWTAELSVEEPRQHVREPCGKGVVAVDVGWRRLPKGRLRVAAWHDEFGDSGQIALSAKTLDYMEKSYELRSTRDKLKNAMQLQLCDWFATIGPLPQWIKEMTIRKREKLPTDKQALATMRMWKVPSRFAALACRWKHRRWSGDDFGYDLLEAWRYRDHHLWAYEGGRRARGLCHRREIYRSVAVQMARTYGTVILENFDKRETAKTPPADETQTEQQEKAQHWRQIACVSQLVDCLKQAAACRGGEAVEIDPAYSTQECPFDDCRHVEKWDAAASIERKPPCPQCGRVWDQDDGAAIVLLRRWKEGRAKLKKKRARYKNTSETRWERVARLKRERDERMAAASDQEE